MPTIVSKDTHKKVKIVLKVSKSQKKKIWISIAQKTNKILDKILPYEASFV